MSFSLLSNYLARVRRVCKSCCSSTTNVNGINQNPIILFTCPSHVILHTLNCNGSNDTSSSPHPLEIVEYPFMNQHQQQPQVYQLLGSCNGLLCIRQGCELDFQVKLYGHGSTNDDAIYLWNPSTKQFKTVPDEPIECPSGGYSSLRISYNFGCNRTMNDYKLIRTVDYYGGDIQYLSKEVKVYTLQTNSWRRINEDIIPNGKPHFIQRQEVYLKGAIHWISNMSSPSVLKPSYEIVSFNVEDEKYQVMPKPKRVDDDDELFFMSAELLVLRQCLCISYRDKNGMELWMMKDYGMKESWTKLFETKNPILQEKWCLKVLWLCKDGKILMKAENEDLILYDPKKDEAEYLHIDRNHIRNWSDAEIYIDNSMCMES